MNRRQFIQAGAAGVFLASNRTYAEEVGQKTRRVGLIGTGWYGKCDLFRMIQVAPVEVVDDPPTNITVTGNTLVGNTGNVAFSGPASRHATVTLDYAINGGPTQHVTIAVLSGDTGSQIAAKARAAIDAVFGLDAGGSGGTVNVVGLGGVLTAFSITVF